MKSPDTEVQPKSYSAHLRQPERAFRPENLATGYREGKLPQEYVEEYSMLPVDVR